MNYRSRMIGLLVMAVSVFALLFNVISELAAQVVLHLSIAVLAVWLLVELRLNTAAINASAAQAKAAATKAAEVQAATVEVHTAVNQQHVDLQRYVRVLVAALTAAGVPVPVDELKEER